MKYPNSKVEKQFNSYEFDAFYDKCTKLCKRNTLMSVITTVTVESRTNAGLLNGIALVLSGINFINFNLF